MPTEQQEKAPDLVEVENTSDHAVDLHDGRTLAPGAKGKTTRVRAEELFGPPSTSKQKG